MGWGTGVGGEDGLGRRFGREGFRRNPDEVSSVCALTTDPAWGLSVRGCLVGPDVGSAMTVVWLGVVTHSGPRSQVSQRDRHTYGWWESGGDGTGETRNRRRQGCGALGCVRMTSVVRRTGTRPLHLPPDSGSDSGLPCLGSGPWGSSVWTSPGPGW